MASTCAVHTLDKKTEAKYKFLGEFCTLRNGEHHTIHDEEHGQTTNGSQGGRGVLQRFANGGRGIYNEAQFYLVLGQI